MDNTSGTTEIIFAQALKIESAAEREAFLDRACPDNPERRREIGELIVASLKAKGFMDQRVASTVLAAGAVNPTVSTAPFELQIGSYTLIQKLGEGGMGEVYLAEQTEAIKRLVAVKIIKAGMDTAQVVARFEVERQTLALMEHPNIARVFDAGTTLSGKPYFVMEYIQGKPFNAFCDEMKMPLRQRLEHFVQICQAIHHAHLKGIIHRDIKPSNVLMMMQDDRPVPKVIDFGLAKAVNQELSERSLTTTQAGIKGTLQYMSPEQADMHATGIDARSDIYSLGVLFYEILTGTTPIERHRVHDSALFDLLQAIREEEAPKPSSRIASSPELSKQLAVARRIESSTKLLREVNGELNWIALRALEKDRTRRYESANAFAKDVERYLNNEPVKACPPSTWYHVKKRLLRNKGVLATAAAILAATAMFGTLAVLHFIGSTQRQLAFDAAVKTAEADDEQGDVERVRTDLEPYMSSGEFATNPAFPRAKRLYSLVCEDLKHAEDFRWKLTAGSQSAALKLRNGTEIEFALIPAGEFEMGSPLTEKEHRDDESQHHVQITQPFYMAKSPVTQEQYAMVTGKTPGRTANRPKNPVEMVSWLDATNFCGKLKLRSGKLKIEFKLPTEAQWEYACRAGSKTRYYTGDSVGDLDKAGWFEKGGIHETQPVCGKDPNKFQLFGFKSILVA